MATTFFGEANGARIFKNGVGIAQVGTPYMLDVQTWDLVPAGEVGDCTFRSVDVSLQCTNGYSIGITPFVDDVALPEQFFNGVGTVTAQLQAFIGARGTRLSARVRSLAVNGDLDLRDISAAFVVLRAVP